MNIFFGADHRGLELKNKLVEYLQEKNIRIQDFGSYQYDPQDDYPDFAQKVAQAIQQAPNEALGIVICGSGVGVTVAANRFRGIYCALGFSEEQIKQARADDHINMLALPADHLDFDQAKKIVDAFITTPGKTEEKYLRRLAKLDQI
jgi:ribose 5-phosphate isomerase B